MARIIYIDGPEKAGKTTICNLLEAYYGWRTRHWGPIEPDDRVYAPILKEDIESDEEVVVWDRAWIAEHVYARLLVRDRMMNDDPWLGAWLHGRAVDAYGYQCILLGPSDREILALRTDDDLNVNVRQETAGYMQYGDEHGVPYFNNHHTAEWANTFVENLHARMTLPHHRSTPPGIPPYYAGPWYANVVVVGQDRKGKKDTIPGAWLPFTSRMTTQFARDAFGRYALEVGWTNAGDIPPQTLRGKAIIACGQKAQKWVQYHIGGGEDVLNIPHPSYLLRWKKGKEQQRTVYETIKKFLYKNL